MGQSTKRTMAETAAYFEQHSVEQLFDELVKGLAAAKPADPKAWIAAQFESAAALTPEAVLQRIQNGDVGSTLSLAGEYGMDHEDFLGVIRSLSAEQYVTFEKAKEQTVYSLSEEGEDYAKNGSPEARLWKAIPDAGVATADVAALCKDLGINAKVAQAKMMQAKFATMDKATKTLKKNGAEIEDKVQNLLNVVQSTQGIGCDVKDLKDLGKRNCVIEKRVLDYKLAKGPRFSLTFTKMTTDITPEMMAKGSWKTAEFKKFNFSGDGVLPASGCLHPLLKVREECRNVFLEMGFEEMPTSRYVESSFWNFDSLFQPQQHPARDAHDTFFLEQPCTSTQIPTDYLERVRQVHQTGGFGSTGYQYEFSEEETRKNVLRTHTTAVSSRMLYAAAQDAMKTGEFQPKKYFSIDRVFRNENLDKTHLAEFHQIEGLVMDRNLCLGDLMGVIAEYFVRIGMVKTKEETQFKPAYNPYTEPSMEIFGYHPDLNCLIEVGNSGMFRPEMLQPMGLPEDVSVIAWGLSLERPTMIKYGIKNIRDLFGSGVNLGFIQNNPICRFDNIEPQPEKVEEEEEGVRGSSTHVDLSNLKDSGSGDLTAEEFAALRAKTKSAAEVAKNMTPEQQAAYGCKTGVAASAVRADSDDSDDEGADFGDMGGEGAGALLGDY